MAIFGLFSSTRSSTKGTTSNAEMEPNFPCSTGGFKPGSRKRSGRPKALPQLFSIHNVTRLTVSIALRHDAQSPVRNRKARIPAAAGWNGNASKTCRTGRRDNGASLVGSGTIPASENM